MIVVRNVLKKNGTHSDNANICSQRNRSSTLLSNSDTEITDINICAWNIQGLTSDKLSNSILGRFMKQFDILLITETWASEHDHFVLPHYIYHNFPRKYLHRKAKRCSGGIGVFIHQKITRGITIWKYFKDIIVWLKFKSDFFNFDQDLYIAVIYLVPEGSTHEEEDLMSILYDHVRLLPSKCDYILCGDLNGRTNNSPVCHVLSNTW